MEHFNTAVSGLGIQESNTTHYNSCISKPPKSVKQFKMQ